MKTIVLLVLILPGIAQAQIFRCETKGETYFSQIPCADNSEAVVIEDRLMFSDGAPETKATEKEPEAQAEPAKSQAENMQDFVSTLYRQRTEQLQGIDKDIGVLGDRLASIGDDPSDGGEREAISQQLASLRESRGSIVEQYESMIAEAERRVAALSDQNAAGDRLN